MATRKAIELIKKDIKYYKKVGALVDEFAGKSSSDFKIGEAPPDSVRTLIIETRKKLYELLSISYNDQIKYYQKILKELEPSKNDVN